MRKISLAIAAFLFTAVLAVPRSADAASAHIKGRILIDVERQGEAWYVSPVSGIRYALGSPAQAFEVMRTLGVGVSVADLSRIATSDAPFDTDANLLPYVRGRILLDVERDGAAWYVDPVSGRRHGLGSPWQALRVMALVGLGAKSADLDAVPVGELRGPYIHHVAPFTAQAPFAEWWDQRQDEGCEEATALMAVRWAHGLGLTPAEAREIIIGAAEYQRKTYGSFQDTSVADTADRIFREFLGYQNIEVRTGIGVEDIAAELRKGNVVAVGVDARKLGNPYFSWPPPLQHMILVTGYDPLADAFIAHDPGTRFGNDTRYGWATLRYALLDYPSGHREPLISRPASMIVVHRASTDRTSSTLASGE